jgi:hypothetical protein
MNDPPAGGWLANRPSHGITFRLHFCKALHKFSETSPDRRTMALHFLNVSVRRPPILRDPLVEGTTRESALHRAPIHKHLHVRHEVEHGINVVVRLSSEKRQGGMSPTSDHPCRIPAVVQVPKCVEIRRISSQGGLATNLPNRECRQNRRRQCSQAIPVCIQKLDDGPHARSLSSRLPSK